MVAKGGITSLSGPHIVQAFVAEVTTSTTDEFLVFANSTGRTVRITSVVYTPDAAVTGNDTNNFIFQCRNKGTDGTGTTGVTSAKTYDTGTDIAAFDQDTLTLSTTAADTDIDDGEVVAINRTVSGSGLTSPQGIVTLQFEYR